MQKDDRIFAIVGTSVAAAVAAIAVLVWLSTGITVDAPHRAAVVAPLQEAPAPVASSAPAVLDEAAGETGDGDNDVVRNAVAHLSAHPGFAALLVTDGLLVRFVMAVDAVAGGYSPRDQIEVLRPPRPFLVREADGKLVAAAGSHHRYDLATDVFDSIAVADAVDLYRRFQPRLEEIYDEVGWSGEDFDSRLCDAIDHLLEVEGISGPFELEQRAIVYAYADDRMEHLSDAQKQLLRMGPANVATVLAKLRELRRAMGWPERTGTDFEADVELTPPEPVVAVTIEDFVSATATEEIVRRVGAVPAP